MILQIPKILSLKKKKNPSLSFPLKLFQNYDSTNSKDSSIQLKKKKNPSLSL